MSKRLPLIIFYVKIDFVKYLISWVNFNLVKKDGKITISATWNSTCHWIFRVLERGQYAYKIDKDGTWFFTLSISTNDIRPSDGGVEKDRKIDMKKDRQVVVGQLARIPKNGPPSIEVLLRIDNFIPITKSGEKERKIQVCDFFKVRAGVVFVPWASRMVISAP